MGNLRLQGQPREMQIAAAPCALPTVQGTTLSQPVTVRAVNLNDVSAAYSFDPMRHIDTVEDLRILCCTYKSSQ